jgi:hypothetical protein
MSLHCPTCGCKSCRCCSKCGYAVCECPKSLKQQIRDLKSRRDALHREIARINAQLDELREALED